MKKNVEIEAAEALLDVGVSLPFLRFDQLPDLVFPAPALSKFFCPLAASGRAA